MTSSRIVVLGVGYVGLTSAACLAHLGHSVMAIDIDHGKIDRLRQGDIPIFEDGLAELVAEGAASGRLTFGTDRNELANCHIVLLCLPTPPSASGSPDTTFLESAVTDIADLLAPDTVVITKSTVPIGTHADVTKWINRADITVVSNPEFLREGRAVSDFLEPDRVIIGALDERSGRVAASIYEPLNTTVQITDPTSAELIKYAANAFLATKISFVNELTRLGDTVNANMADVAEGLGSDARIGASYLAPGPGWGGSCFPKDVLAIEAMGHELGLSLDVIEATLRSNERQFDHIVNRVKALCEKPLTEATVAMWGLAFKAGTDDTRVSPALAIIDRLRDAGATIVAHDPVASVPADIAKTGDMYEICDDADILIVTTEWSDYAQADPAKVVGRLATPCVFDTRNVLDAGQWRAAGIKINRLGRPD